MCREYPTLPSVTVTLIYTGTFVSVQNLCLAVQNGRCVQVIHTKGNINVIKVYNIVILHNILYACEETIRTACVRTMCFVECLIPRG
jgi:hypothetical protein